MSDDRDRPDSGGARSVGAGAAPEATGHERTTWAELFFDLVLVFAITQTAHILGADPDWSGLLRMLIVLAPLWWGWVGVTLLVNGVEETNVQRLQLFACGLCAFFMAIAAPGALSADRTHAIVFAVGYFALRLVLAEAMRRKHAFPMALNPYTVAVGTSLVLVAGAPLPPGLREIVWACAIVLELTVPAVLGRRILSMPWGYTHLPERFGSFVIIALGELVVDTGSRASDVHLSAAVMVTVAFGFVLGVALWWLYFNFASSAITHALHIHPTPGVLVRDVLSYAHFALVTGLMLVAVGVGDAVEDPMHRAHGLAAALTPLGAAIFTLTFCYTRSRMFGAAGLARMVCGLALLVVAAVSPLLCGLAVVLITTALLLLLNGFEAYWVRSGRHILLVGHDR